MIFGVLGFGSIGSRHAKNLLSLGQKVAIYDPSSERCDLAENSGIDIFSERHSLIEKSTALIIASPNQFHLNDLKDGIGANCHCFVEKPISHTIVGLEAILDQAEEKNRKIFCGLNLRFNPATLKAKTLIEKKVIGQPQWATLTSSHYLPDWRPQQNFLEGYTADRFTGGVIFDIIHEFDLANYLLGPGRTILAAARNTGAINLPSEDCADIILAHNSGIHSNLHLDYVTRPTQRITKIGAPQGVIEINFVTRTVSHNNKNGDLENYYDFSQTNSNDDYKNEMTAFINCIKNNSPSPCSGYDGIKVLKQVIEARELCKLPKL